MSSIRAPLSPPEERYAARARRARGWAWRLRVMLVAGVGVAIWQEPRIWPQGHDTLRGTVETLAGMLESKEQVRSLFDGLTGEHGSDGEREGFADRIAGLLSR